MCSEPYLADRRIKFSACLFSSVCFHISSTMSYVALSPLAQSADKQLLFARLGLNEQVHKLLLVSRSCCMECTRSIDREIVCRAKLKPRETG
jgi:hypothetical protein